MLQSHALSRAHTPSPSSQMNPYREQASCLTTYFKVTILLQVPEQERRYNYFFYKKYEEITASFQNYFFFEYSLIMYN